MMALTREASDRLNQYLEEMRASLRGSTTIDVAEVEQDIRDHIGAELADRPSPVSADELNTVLSRLGTPGQWGADPAQPATPVSSSSVFGGSLEDRLCYASAGSMLLFLVFPPLLIVSWLLARWTLARIEERGEPLGARRWLLYPPIAIVVAPLGVIALLWAFAPFAEAAGRFYRQPRLFYSPFPNALGALTFAFAGLGVYWVFLGTCAAFGDRLVRFFFYPFAQGFRRRHGWWLMGVGAALFAVAAASLVFFLEFLRGR